MLICEGRELLLGGVFQCSINVPPSVAAPAQTQSTALGVVGLFCMKNRHWQNRDRWELWGHMPMVRSSAEHIQKRCLQANRGETRKLCLELFGRHLLGSRCRHLLSKEQNMFSFDNFEGRRIKIMFQEKGLNASFFRLACIRQTKSPESRQPLAQDPLPKKPRGAHNVFFNSAAWSSDVHARWKNWLKLTRTGTHDQCWKAYRPCWILKLALF